jgi:hypothetical protein
MVAVNVNFDEVSMPYVSTSLIQRVHEEHEDQIRMAPVLWFLLPPAWKFGTSTVTNSSYVLSHDGRS